MNPANQPPAVIAVRPWGRHGLWLAIVMDGSTVVKRILALSEESAYERARAQMTPRPVVRSTWAEIPDPRMTDD